MQHPEEGTIHAWLDGALSPSEASAIQSHVASCADCAAAVADARGMIAASSRIVGHLDVTPGNVIPATPIKTKRSWIFTALPTAIAATLVLGIALNGIRERKTVVFPTVETQPSVVTSRESAAMPVAPPPPSARVAQQTAPPTIGPVPDSPSLPPASAALQKSTVVAATPTAAPRLDSLRRDRAETRGLSLSEVVVTGADAQDQRRIGVGAVGGVARAAGGVGGVAPPAAAAAAERSVAPQVANAVDTLPPFVGCYEAIGLSRPGQPPVIPRTSSEPARSLSRSGYAAVERYDRFALMDEAAPTPGQFAVRVLDPAGRPDQAIYGAGWSVQGNRAIVRASNGQIVVTLTKSDSGIISSGGAVRVISCRK